jgi:hypothetical protein
MKAKGAPQLDVGEAVNELKHRRKILEDAVQALLPKTKAGELEAKFDRFKMEELLKRRFFYVQSFSIYGGNLWIRIINTKIPLNHLFLDSAPNPGPLISLWEINKFQNC